MPFLNFFSKRNKVGFLSIALLSILLVSGALATSVATSKSNSTGAASSALAASSRPFHLSHTMVPASTSGSLFAGPDGCPLADSNCLASYNWGGYAVCVPSSSCSNLEAAPGTVTEVQGSWVVPAIVQGGGSTGSSCQDNEKTWYDMADWVGIDGFVSQTVEQTGTSSDCYYGQTYYYAWYEFYPAPSYSVFNVSAGDVMSAQVTYNAAKQLFSTTITDLTSHKSYTSAPTAVAGAETDSAEWIAESAYFNGFLALTQTNQVQFFDASATIGGVTHPLGGWGPNVYWLLMVDYNFGFNQECSALCPTPQTETLAYAKAQPSVLGSSYGYGVPDGSSDNDASFQVTWLSSGP